MERIYLDNAATTPLHPRVASAMRRFDKNFGNPSSIHREGQAARAAIDYARAGLASFFACKPQEIIFTSGATESNNLAIQGTVGQAISNSNTKPHVITTELEHHSVYSLVKELERRGAIEATYIKPDKKGLIKAEDVITEIKDNTVLVSVIFVSNEIGSVLPVREIGRAINDINIRQRQPILFHTDAVAAVKYYNCNVEKLGADLLTFTSHKIGGPKGIGGLFLKSGTKLQEIIVGGSQEYGRRAGTQNAPGIIGMEQAFKLLGSLEQRQENAAKTAALRDLLIGELCEIKGAKLNGPTGDKRSPDNVNLTFANVDQETLLTAVDLMGIAVSSGSACVSGSTEPSHVISALGNKDTGAVIRLTLADGMSKQEISKAAKLIKTAVNKLKA